MIYSGHADGTVRSSAYPSRRAGSDHCFRSPTPRDAGAVAALIAASPPLDGNSLYCNLLQCTHFAGTCIIASRDGEIDGWISGYRPPDQPEALFVWQVAVHERARGAGLGVAMLEALFERNDMSDARWLKTSVTPSNRASLRMFEKFAAKRGAPMRREPWFDAAAHFGGRHESEDLYSIGPLPIPMPTQSTRKESR